MLNWYRRIFAQEAEQSYPNLPSGTTWMDYGHYYKTDEEGQYNHPEDAIWVLAEGKLLVKRYKEYPEGTMGRDFGHGQFPDKYWGENLIYELCGRYDARKNVVTISGAIRNKSRRFPTALSKMLENEFPGATTYQQIQYEELPLKTAQVVRNKAEQAYPPLPEDDTYYSYGHAVEEGKEYQNPEDELWLFSNAGFQTCSFKEWQNMGGDEMDFMHDEVFLSSKPITGNMDLYGRFDREKNVVTMTGFIKTIHGKVPPQLIRTLEQRWPGATVYQDNVEHRPI